MQHSDIYTIHWGFLTRHVYLYGSMLTHHNYRIDFENTMMPPEVAIKVWHSLTNYQQDRHEPLLPFLEGGKRYYVRSYIETTPKNACFLRFNFYNHRDENIGSFMTNKSIDVFEYPKDCYYYNLELLRGSAQKIVYERIDLSLDDYDEPRDYDRGEYNVICLEPQGEVLKYPKEELLEKYDHPIILLGRESSDQFDEVIKRNTYKKLHLICYGPIGKRIFNKLSLRYPRSELIDLTIAQNERKKFSERFTDHRYLLGDDL
jgi:accessory Sec system protein Asp3